MRREHPMANQQERSAKNEKGVFWRTCPICDRGNAASPRFKTFLPLITHMAEHLVDWEQVPSTDTGDVFLSSQRPPKQKIPPRAKLLLAMVADWLERALKAFPEINSFTTDRGSIGKSERRTRGRIRRAARIPSHARGQASGHRHGPQMAA